MFFSFFLCDPSVVLAEEIKNISGIINSYARVTNITETHITIDQVQGNILDFHPGKKMMILQMKGATMQQESNNGYGNIVNIGGCGLHEFLVAEGLSGTGPTYDILYADLIHTYSTEALVQVISVPIYQNVNISSPLTAVNWNPSTGTGGVLALEVSGTLSLNADIDVSGKGFRGGVKGGSSGANNNATTIKSSSNEFGMKGESISLIVSGENYAKGKHATGGGGGNTHNGGGGGGGNSTAGGNGGNGWSGAGVNANTGGIGGASIDYSIHKQRIMLGGGGGSGQQNNNAGGSGGNGGGIIVIRAGNITTTEAASISIRANGTHGENAGNDGAGGGGAGGTIKIESTKWSAGQHLHIQANGGHGGSVANSAAHGSGGGGGIGIIQLKSPIPDHNNIRVASSPGTNGRDCNLTDCTSSGTSPMTPLDNDEIITGIVFFGDLTGLPVSLLNFSAIQSNQHIILYWTTSCEINNDYFTLEKSLDGKNFQPLKNIPGKGSTRLEQKYNFTDENPNQCNNYYRLSQTDFDGTQHFFPLIWVQGIQKTMSDLQIICVFPNRFHRELKINFYSAHEGEIELNFLNLRGENIFQYYFSALEGINQITFTEGHLLGEDIYIIYLRSAQALSKKLRILKQSI
ncbi:MAG: hypothetical protein JJU28_14605 [Cyclobacteriaceae bacterium]|nr:hypothetical protein [Cyclobacteriaceae bacterium]